MNCNFVGIKTNEFLAKEIKKVAEKFIKGNSAKAIQILGARVNEDFIGFRKFLVEYLNNKNIKRANGEVFTVDTFDSIDGVVNEIKELKSSVNIIDGALFAYYKHIYHSVNNYNTILEDVHNLNFITTTAEDEAVNYVAHQLVEKLYSNSKLGKNNRLDNRQIFQMIKREIFNNISNSIYPTQVALLLKDKNLKKSIKDKIKSIDELKTIVNKLKNSLDKYNNAVLSNNKDELADFNNNDLHGSDYNFDTVAELNTFYRAKANELTNALLSFIENYGSDQAKNNIAMFRALNNDYFKKRVSNHQLLHNFSEDVAEAFISDELNTEDENNIGIVENESIDETTKRWNENVKSSFMNYIDSDMRYKLSQVRRGTAFCPYGEVENNYYDKNNELGIETYHNVQEIITELIDFGDFNSIGSFIASIEQHAKNNPYFYGLSFLVNEMKDNFPFACSIWRNLAKPVVSKNMKIISMNGSIESVEANKNNTARNSLINSLFNTIKSSYRNFTETDIQSLANHARNLKSAETTSFIIEKLNYYFPRLDVKSIQKAIDVNPDNAKKLINALGEILKSYNATKLNYEFEYNKYLEDKKSNKSLTFNRRNAYDLSGKNSVEQAIITIGDVMYKFVKNDTELNSFNAEMNLSTDLLNNCYISRVFQAINNNDTNVLLSLGQQIANCPQYEFSPLFFGVKHKDVEIPGLFIKKEGDDGAVIIDVNTEGVNRMKYSLFNGVRTEDYSKSVLYSGMSEGDYFTTILHMYFNPTFNTVDNTVKKLTNNDVCEIFLPTPSDAPKNFTMFIPNYHFTHRNVKTVGINSKNQDYILKVKEGQYAESLNLYHGDDIVPNSYEFVEDGDIIKDKVMSYITTRINKKNKEGENNEVLSTTEEEILDLVQSKYKDSIRRSFVIEGMNNYHPVIYTNETNGVKTYHVVIIKGDLLEYTKNNKKVTTDIVLNPNIYTTFSFVENEKSDTKTKSKYLTLNTNINNSLPKTLVNINKQQIIEDYIIQDIKEQGKHIIEESIFDVADTPMREVFKQEVLGEMNSMINALNNVFESSGDIRYIKNIDGIEDLTDLIDTYHFNKTIVKNGKLTGRVFEFTKLFNIKIGDNVKYSANEELLKLLGLYQNDDTFGIIKTDTDGKLYIDVRSILENKENSFISIDEKGRFKLQIPNSEGIYNIVDKWMKLYAYSIVNEYQRFSHVAKQNNFSYENTIEAMFGNVIGLYNSSELFYGEDTFYKDSRTFLKRAKEAQAGGHAYAFYDVTHADNQPIVPLQTIEGINMQKEIERTFTYELTDDKGKKHLYRLQENGQNLFYRNGYNAVTINNTISAIEGNEGIYEELLNTLIDRGVAKDIADKIASSIAGRYGYNKGAKTKVNDAQSYITFEEFVMRRVADGTIDEYRDLITQILEVRQGYRKLENIDLDGITSRIQIQKNFYFDMNIYTDPVTGKSIRCGRQIKNAEFVLIPELLVGTDLYDLYQIMTKYNIQQINTVETSKASKRNILTFWDNNGKAHPEKFDEALSKEKGNPKAIESFYYKYLYKQQDVPQHMVDAQNKAGIQILKKLMDNATEETKPYIDKFLKNYVANIESSFNELMFACGWKINDDGTLVNMDGSKVSFEYFNEKAKREATRLGLDTNFVEYFELDETTKQPKLPNWMNNVSSKIESISNGIFNSMITRQTLPGWHGAQVTSVGYGRFARDINGDIKELRYHPEVKDKDGNVTKQSVIEIMIPRWSALLKGINIEQIGKEGLDTMIIYRMPTEGKQSIAIAKVVGILPDTYGSSVMVPHGWVTQTGSDFDVDSIYAITKEMKKTMEGIKAIIPADLSVEENLKKAYIRYVSNLTDIKIKKGFYLENDESIEQLQNINEEFNKLHAEFDGTKQTLADKRKLLNDRIDKAFAKTADGKITDLARKFSVKKKAIDNNEENYNTIKDGKKIKNLNYYLQLKESLKELVNEVHEKDKKKVNNLIKRCDAVIEALVERTSFLENMPGIKEELIASKKALQEEAFEKVKQIAKENNIISFEEFQELPDEMKQTREVRNNEILDAMINIMSSNSSKEENYSGSKFNHIVGAIRKVDELTGRNSAFESPYNPFTQIQYFNDAMSGAMLKAFSVSRDNGNSIFNYTKAVITEPITVRYYNDVVYYDDNADRDKTGSTYNLDEIEKSYKGDTVKEGNSITVTHRRLANSENYRNVVQELITAYGSETTAHILDAIKEGTIFNENTFTFGTFKTLIDLGVDFTTGISWLALPGISLICEKYYDTNSVYTDDSGNPIQNAVRELARRANIVINNKKVNEYTSYKSIVEYFKNPKNIIKIENEAGESVVANISKIANQLGYNLESKEFFTIDTKLIERRLSTGSNKLTELESIVFDFITIMQFEKLNSITKKMENLIRLSNPDKFGAKQSVRETFETIYKINTYRGETTTSTENIENSIFNTNTDETYVDVNETGSIIMIDGKNYIDAIYPINEKGEIDVEKSAYQYLAAFLKYSTNASVSISKMLFELEDLLIKNEFNSSENQLSIFGRKLTNAEYKEFKQYLVSKIYANTQLHFKLKYNHETGDIEYDYATDPDQEIARIKGNETMLPYTINSFTIKDINNPTEEEISKFLLLTPAQKVLAMQRLFKDDRGIFSKFDLDFYGTQENINKGLYAHTIRINTQNESIEELYKMFNNIATSKHPLIKLTAIDLIKYAFIAEGFRFKKNGVAKIITNAALFDNKLISIKGIETNNIIDDIKLSFNDIELSKVFTDFVRNHSNIIQSNSVLMRFGAGKDRGSIKTYKRGYNSYYITDEEIINSLVETYVGSSKDASIYEIPKYIKLKHKIHREIPVIIDGIDTGERISNGYETVNQLFEVVPLENGKIFLLGVPTLEINEIEHVSQNEENNYMKYGERKEYYLKADDLYRTSFIDSIVKADDESKQYWNDIKNTARTSRVKNKNISKNLIHEDYIEESLNSKDITLKTNAETLISYIEQYLTGENLDNNFLIYATNNLLQNILTKNIDKIPLNVTINGVRYKLFVTKGISTKRWYGAMKGNEKSIAALPAKYKYAYDKSSKSTLDSQYSRLYNIQLITEEEYNAQQEEDVQMLSTVSGLEFIENDSVRNNPFETLRDSTTRDDIDFISNILHNFTKNNDYMNDPYIEKVKEYVRFNNIEISSFSSIDRNLNQLMALVKEYYENKSKYFIEKFGNFFESEVNPIAIDSDAMIETLRENPELFNQVIRFLLEARTFGKSARQFAAGVDTANTELNNYIQNIVNSVTRVVGDTRLSKAYRRMFNEYIGERFSDNPNIKMQLLDLSTSFDDATFMDNWIADIGELSNKQVQVVFNRINNVLNSVQRLTIPKEQARFVEEFDKYDKDIRWNLIIDPSTGKFVREYTDKYIEDKRKVLNDEKIAKQNLDIAKNNYLDALNTEENIERYTKEYEKALIDYQKAFLTKSKWFARNVEQEMLQEYYDEYNENLEQILYSEFTEEFGTYLRLKEDLRRYSTGGNHYTKEEADAVNNIKAAMSAIINPALTVNSNNSIDFFEEARPRTPEEIAKEAKNLRQSVVFDTYITRNKEINNKYFVYEPNEEWIRTRDVNIKIISDFERDNPDLSLEQKMNNVVYADAYNWLKANTIKTLNKEGFEKISKYRKVLGVGSTHKGNIIYNILRDAEAYDEYGQLDPSKLSEEDIIKIREIYQDYYDNLAKREEEGILVKEVPQSPIMTNDYNRLFDGLRKDTSENRKAIIQNINKILIKAVDQKTGQISTKLLFDNNNVTEDERKELGRLYQALRIVEPTVKNKKEVTQRINNVVEHLTNDAAFLRELNYAKGEFADNSQEMRLWKNIFCEKDEDGSFVIDKNSYTPNTFIYGYTSIKKDKNGNYPDKYVDKAKTEAADFMRHNTHKVFTEAYYNARNEAISRGVDEYNKWYELNHFYNAISHKWEPLSIWTKTEAIPGKELYKDVLSEEEIENYLTTEEATYGYNPTFENNKRFAKEEFINKPNGEEYNRYNDNYKDSGEYHNPAISTLTENERNMRNLLMRKTKEYAFTNKAKRFTEQGYVPREYKTPIDAKFITKQVLGLAGIDWIPSNKQWNDISFSEDVLPEQQMYDFIKTVGFKEKKAYPEKPISTTREAIDRYNAEVEAIRKENEEIDKHNRELEKQYRDTNYKEIFKNVIAQGEEYKTKQELKNLVYFLIEDLQSTDNTYSNRAYRRNKRTDKLLKKNRKVTNTDSNYKTIEQNRTIEVVINTARRILHKQFKEPYKLNTLATALQSFTSAKYMYANLPGGVTNVLIGWTNIIGEIFGQDYLENKYVTSALSEYSKGLFDYMGSALVDSKPNTKVAALIDLMRVVDYDAMLQRQPNEDLSKYISRARNLMFTFQTSGEHFMQNVVMVAMMKSHRLYKSTDRYGKETIKIGTFANYSWDIEQQAMRITLNEIAKKEGTSAETMQELYKQYIDLNYNTIEELDKIDQFKTNINKDFLKNSFADKYQEYANIYIDIRKQLSNKAKEDFENNNESFYDQFVFENGTIKLKADSILIGEDGNPIKEYQNEIFGKFVSKVISVNKKIHGVYDKIGAARIENQWWGSLLMQYHKHIYPGIMKRFRGLFNRAYYNEYRQSVEKGSYVSFIEFMSTEFKDVLKNARADVEERNSIYALAITKEVFNGIINTFSHLKTNWNMMQDWERHNCRRVLGDLLGIGAAFAIAIAIYGLTDDDELKESNTLSAMLYIADSFYAQSRMYTPKGLYVEAKTLWSSPIATTNGLVDILKIADVWSNILFDEEFNPYYTTGQYRGKHKAAVAFYRNILVYRVFNRMSNFTSYNKYYRLGDTGVLKNAKSVANWIAPDK